VCIHSTLCRKPIGVFRNEGKRPKKATKVRKDMAKIAMITLRREPIRAMRDAPATAHHRSPVETLKLFSFYRSPNLA